jgi:hypothetical protein
MKNEGLLGVWRVVSLIGESSEGEVVHYYGEAPQGTLIYDAGGYMSVVVMRSGRARFEDGDPFGGTSEEIKEAFEGFDAYTGTFDVNLEQGVVTHHIEASRFPNWEGSDQVRYFEISGDRLHLSTPSIPARETEWVLKVTWERAE